MSNYVEKSNIISALQRFHENDMNLFATKDEVQASVNAEASARELQDRLIDIRLTNLEQTSGQQEVTVSYPDDGTYSSIMPEGIPASAAKYAEVPSIKGKTRAWNQICDMSDGTGTEQISSNTVVFQASHYYLFTLKVSFPTVPSEASGSGNPWAPVILGFWNNNRTEYRRAIFPYQSNGTYMKVSQGSTLNGTLADGISSKLKLQLFPNSGESATYSDVMVRDLTLIFGAGNEPATVDDALKALPDLAKWDDYNAGSLVDTTVIGVKSISPNLFDENWFLLIGDWTKSGEYYTGLPNGDRTVFFAKLASDLNPKIAGKRITISFRAYNVSSGGGMIFQINYTDGTADTVRINSTTETSYALTSNSNKTVQSFSVTYSTSIQCYIKNFQIEIGATATPYVPFGVVDSLMLSSPFTGKSAGSVAEELDIRTGKKTRPVGSIDLSLINWTARGNSVFSGRIANVPNSQFAIQCAKYLTDNSLSATTILNYDKVISSYASYNVRTIMIRDTAYSEYTAQEFAAAMEGQTLNYEYLEPDPDEQVCDPIPDNFLEVQGGGTIRTIQSQSPVIDNCLDVTYDLIPSA